MMYAYSVPMESGRSFVVAVVALAVVMSGYRAHAQPGWVLSHQKISDTEGGFTGELDDSDLFGISVASLGDLDGDGVGDLAVGAFFDDDGGEDRGAVWILFLDGVPCDPCDMNCDGDINAFDIEPFLDLLFDPNPQPCNTCTGDVNADGNINAFDIEPFLNCLFGP